MSSKLEHSLSLLCLLAIANVSFASDMITEDDLFGELHLVSGVTHMKQRVDKTPAAITIIDRRTIEASAAVDVMDLFRLVPGFHAYYINANYPGVTYHALGDSNPRRLEVKVDGRSVYESIFSSVQWTTLGVELEDIDYVEVVRGANAPADGSNAFLASINIVTRSPLLDSGLSVRSQIGNDGIRNGSFAYSGKLGDINHRTTLRYRSNDGFDDFSGMYKGTPHSVALDDVAEAVTFGFRGLWTPNAKDSVELQFGVNNSDIGIGKQEYLQREIDYDYQHLNWSRINPDGTKYEFVFYHNKFDIADDQNPLTFYQALNLFPEGPLRDALSQLPDKLIIEPQSKAVSERWDAEIRGTFRAWDNIRGAYGAGKRRDKVRSNDLFDMDDTASETSYRGYINMEWNALDSLVFNGGFITEIRDDQDDLNSFRLAANYQFSPSQTLRFAFNQGYRAPTLLESNQATFVRYDENLVLDAGVLSADDIDAERLLSSEIGYVGAFLQGRLNFDLRLFRESMSSVIGERRQHYDDYDGQLNIRDNTGTAEIKGVEWQLQYRPTEKFLVHANYSFVDLEQIRVYWSAPALEIRDVSGANPRHLGSILVNYVTDNSLSLSAMLNYKSTVYHRTAEDNPSYARLDLKAAKSWQIKNTQAQLSLTIQNVGDQYRERYFYNLFKTRVILGMQLDF
jgi:iron complex outermembrane receptor protein